MTYEVNTVDEARVEKMARLGFKQEEIAVVLEMSLKTLRKHFKQCLEKSPLLANTEVLEKLFHLAVSGTNATALIFWAKTRCGLGTPEKDDQRGKEETHTMLVVCE